VFFIFLSFSFCRSILFEPFVFLRRSIFLSDFDNLEKKAAERAKREEKEREESGKRRREKAETVLPPLLQATIEVSKSNEIVILNFAANSSFIINVKVERNGNEIVNEDRIMMDRVCLSFSTEEIGGKKKKNGGKASKKSPRNREEKRRRRKKKGRGRKDKSVKKKGRGRKEKSVKGRVCVISMFFRSFFS